MAVLLWILRSTFTFLLGLVLFATFLVWLVAGVALKLFDAWPYVDALREQDAYQRFFDQVMAEDSPNSPMRDLLHEVPGVTYKEKIALLREIVPPSYWQTQTEGNLDRAAAYWKGEAPTLELYLDLTEPRSRVHKVVQAHLDRFVDHLDIIEPAWSLNLATQFTFARDVTESLYVILVLGEVPERIPSASIIPGVARPFVFDLVMTRLPERLALDQASRRELERATSALRERFLAGDTRGFLKQALAALVLPLVDEGFDRAIAGFPQDSQGRVNLLAAVANTLGPPDADSLSQEVEVQGASLRQDLYRAQRAALVATLVATLAMGLVFLPHWRAGLRWSGLGLLLTGLITFAMVWVAQTRLPELTAILVGDELNGRGWSPLAAALAADVLRAVMENLLSGAGAPGLWLALAGALLFLAPYGWDRWLQPQREDQGTKTKPGDGAG